MIAGTAPLVVAVRGEGTVEVGGTTTMEIEGGMVARGGGVRTTIGGEMTDLQRDQG